MNTRRTVTALAAILLGLLAVEMGLLARMQALNSRALESPDTPSYEQPAQALRQAGRFAAGPDRLSEPEVTRTPGYPLLIAAAESALGDDPANAVRLAMLVGAAGLLVLYAGARRLGLGAGAAILAVALAAIEPGSLLASQMLLPETLFTALLTAMLYCGVRLIELGRRALAFALAMGAALAAATAVRPITYYLVAPIVLWLCLAARAQGVSRGRTAALAAAMLAPWLVIVGGWQVRNAAVFGDPTFSQIQNVNLYRYRGADVVARRDGLTLGQAQDRLQAIAEAAVPAGPARFRYFKTEGMRLLKEYPGLAVRSAIAGLAKTVAGPGSIDLYMHLAGPLPTPGPLADVVHAPFGEFWRRWVRGYPVLVAMLAAESFYLAALYLGSLAALVFGWSAIRRAFFAHALWAGTAAYLVVVSAGPEAYARFRVPMVPVLACYGAWGCALLLERLRGTARDARVSPGSSDD